MARANVRRAAPRVIEQDDEPEVVERAPDQPPLDWIKGQLLNVRNYGAEYIITRHPEEYDQEHQDRAMKFTNLGECQDFVSAWYARESHDPRVR